MALALYYKATWERFRKRIEAVAPDLDVALLDEEGGISIDEREVVLDSIEPNYFWLHSELYGSPQRSRYFEIMQECPSAEWLHTVNTGLDQLPYLPLLQKGMTITNNNAQAIAIAEYVFARLLAYFQHVDELKSLQRQSKWKSMPFRELNAQHWVIVGFGNIGREIAKRASAFGVTVTAIRRKNDDEGLAERVLQADYLSHVLPSADVVVLALTSNNKTRDMVDKTFLSYMKNDAVLVNIARGELIVDSDLKDALDHHIISYAILDVFREEPLPEESWQWRHPRVSVSPHNANRGSGMKERSVNLYLENLKRKVSGERLINLVTEDDIV